MRLPLARQLLISVLSPLVGLHLDWTHLFWPLALPRSTWFIIASDWLWLWQTHSRMYTCKYQTTVAVSRSRWLVNGVTGGSPSMTFVSTMLAKHMSIVENQLAKGCLRDNTCESITKYHTTLLLLPTLVLATADRQRNCGNSNQIFHNDKKYSSWLVPKCVQQIQDSRRPPSWKEKNQSIGLSQQPFDRFR